MSRSFDGVDDEINLGTMSSWNPVTCSFACWIKPDSFGQGPNLGRVFDKAEVTTNSHRLGLILDGTGAPAVNTFAMRRDYATTDAFAQAANDTIVLNVWQFIAGTCDGPNCLTYYASISSSVSDVTNLASRTSSSGTLRDLTANSGIIGNNDISAREYSGLIAHFHAYDVALTLQELQQISRFPGSVRRGLIAYLPLFGTASPEPDYSVNGNDGTVNGTTSGTSQPPINGIFYPKRQNLYYSSFSTAVVSSAATRSTLMMMMGVS